MPKALRVVLAVVIGFVVGSAVNMGFIMLSGKVIPPPSGADVTTMEGLKASLHLFEPKHFLFPFLAHAGGTLAGAFVAALLAPGRSPVPSYMVGALFLLGGLAAEEERLLAEWEALKRNASGEQPNLHRMNLNVAAPALPEGGARAPV